MDRVTPGFNAPQWAVLSCLWLRAHGDEKCNSAETWAACGQFERLNEARGLKGIGVDMWSEPRDHWKRRDLVRPTTQWRTISVAYEAGDARFDGRLKPRPSF